MAKKKAKAKAKPKKASPAPAKQKKAPKPKAKPAPKPKAKPAPKPGPTPQISASRGDALAAVDDNLADAFGDDSSFTETMTGIVDTLEKKGLVTRQPNPEDRRSLLVALTEKGKALEDSTPDLEIIYAKCCVGLSAEEFRQLGLLLEKLDQSLDCTC